MGGVNFRERSQKNQMPSAVNSDFVTDLKNLTSLLITFVPQKTTALSILFSGIQMLSSEINTKQNNRFDS